MTSNHTETETNTKFSSFVARLLRWRESIAHSSLLKCQRMVGLFFLWPAFVMAVRPFVHFSIYNRIIFGALSPSLSLCMNMTHQHHLIFVCWEKRASERVSERTLIKNIRFISIILSLRVSEWVTECVSVFVRVFAVIWTRWALPLKWIRNQITGYNHCYFVYYYCIRIVAHKNRFGFV